MEVENKYAQRGVANAGLTTGIIGTALGVLNNGGIGNILNTNNRSTGCGCSEDHYVNRYEAAQAARISELETEIKLRDANTFTLGEMDKLRNYFESKIDCVEKQICQQNVINAQITANLSCMQGSINTLMGLTKTIVPIGNVCPEPMPQYNSWAAPTAGATT
jgi:hypothetical protein